MSKKRHVTLPSVADPAAKAAGQGPEGATETVAAALAPGDEAVVRRTRDGWRVGDDELPDLTCAMVLADLLAAELPAEAPRPGPAALAAPQGDGGAGQDEDLAADEAHRLRTTVGQLQHALAARIRIEQAIGVLAERHRIRPRQAFEQLRSAARNRGRRVIDIAADVVASATNPLLQLPEELARQRSSPRRTARSATQILRSE